MSTFVGVAFGSSLDGPPTLNLLPTPLVLHMLGNKSQVVLCQAYIQAFFDVLFACMEKRVKGQWFARGFLFP